MIIPDFLRPTEAASARLKFLIFTEGTLLGPEHWWDFFFVRRYKPIGCAVKKINVWVAQGAQVNYLTSRRAKAEVDAVRIILEDAGLGGNHLYYRGRDEDYHHVAERLNPDVLIEDDCRSIGGSCHWVITHVTPVLKDRITSIVVPEFGGIDHLPNKLKELLNYRSKPTDVS